MTIYTLDEVQDKLIGKVGTPDRDKFEYELQMDLIGKAIKKRLILTQKHQNRAFILRG